MSNWFVSDSDCVVCGGVWFGLINYENIHHPWARHKGTRHRTSAVPLRSGRILRIFNAWNNSGHIAYIHSVSCSFIKITYIFILIISGGIRWWSVTLNCILIIAIDNVGFNLISIHHLQPHISIIQLMTMERSAAIHSIMTQWLTHFIPSFLTDLPDG